MSVRITQLPQALRDKIAVSSTTSVIGFGMDVWIRVTFIDGRQLDMPFDYTEEQMLARIALEAP